MLWEAVLTAVVAGFAPWTLLIVATLLGRERPMHHALVFLASAAVVTLLVGFLVVEALGSTNLEDRHRHHSVSPAIDLGLGIAILLFVPYLAHRSPGKSTKSDKQRKIKKPRWLRTPQKSGSHWREEAGLITVIALGAFAGSPSPLYLASLHSITKGRPDATAGTLEVLLLAAIVLFMAEIPILCYMLAPERTTALLKAANAWLARNGRIIVILGASAAGCYFTVNGLVHLL